MPYLPFTTILENNQFVLQPHGVTFSQQKYVKNFLYVKNGLKIAKAKFAKETPLKGSEKNIIEQIHTIRFHEHNPYVITGGHFSQLFVRNLGIFYNALLDPRIPASEEDWRSRQAIALRTVALDLSAFQQAKKEYTTIVPVKGKLFTGLNIYARPADSLFAIVYTLLALSDDSFIEQLFPAVTLAKKTLLTKHAAKELLQTYSPCLVQLLKTYVNEVIDPQTQLVKSDLLLASARDGIKRQSSFYDNVIVWATIRLSKKLNLHEISESDLEDWKQRIIQKFWDKTAGIFRDDLSEISRNNVLFSADSFITLSTGFFHTSKKKDMEYIERMVNYVKRHNIDQPFPLHYSTLDLPKKLYWPVRNFAPSYMGTSIWSHWGMEYIKALIYLGKTNQKYLADAKKHLETYRRNIETYGGYPEVYDKTGKLLQTRLYRSVLHNGWVVNYEQTRMLFNANL